MRKLFSGDRLRRVVRTLALTRRIGVHSVWIPADAMTPRPTNGASPELFEMTTNKNVIPVLAFDQTTQEFAHFSVRAPKSWDAGTLSATILATSNNVSTNSFVFGIRGVAISSGESFDQAFSSFSQVTITPTSTVQRLIVSSAVSSISINNSPSKQDFLNFEIARVPADGSDTHPADAFLVGVELNFTLDAGNDA